MSEQFSLFLFPLVLLVRFYFSFVSTLSLLSNRLLNVWWFFLRRRPLLHNNDDEVLIVGYNQFLTTCFDSQVLEIIIRIEIPRNILGSLGKLGHALCVHVLKENRKRVRFHYWVESSRHTIHTSFTNLSPEQYSRQYLLGWIQIDVEQPHRSCRWHSWQLQKQRDDNE